MKALSLTALILWPIIFDACASRHRRNEESLPNPVGDNIDTKPVITDPKTLVISPNQLTLEPITICKSEKAASVYAKTDKDADYFEVQICKDPNSCQSSSFMGSNLILGPQPAASYTIAARACLEPHHSTDPKMVCGEWTKPPVTHNFESLSENAQKLIQHQMDLRNEMSQVCQDMQASMHQYLQNADKRDPLRAIIFKHVDSIGINVCRDLLLSPELHALETLNQASQNTQTPQVIQIQSKSRLEGLVFLSIGALGFALGATQTYRA